MIGSILRTTALAAAVAIGLGAAAGEAGAAEKVRWKMASAFPSSLVHLGTTGKPFAEHVETLTGGTVNIRFYEPGALVPPLEIFEAVSKGSIDAGWTSPGYHIGKFPSVSMFSSFPFGPREAEFLAWLKYGGGLKFYDELYGKHNVKGFPCLLIPPEAGGWFNKEIKSVEDLKGLKMRFAGYGGKVMEKLGVSTQLLAPGDIYPALELGTIDATEFSMPAIDLGSGFYQVAKYYYFPGWQQQATLHELLVNMDRWKALDKTQQAQIQAACDASLINSMAHGGILNMKAMDELRSKGVEIRQYPPDVIEAMRKAWAEVIEENRKSTPEFKEAWDSFAAFHEKYAAWGKIAHVE